MFELIGKVALLTGATGGIPRATAALLRRLGAHLVLTDLDQAALDDLAATLPVADQRILTGLESGIATEYVLRDLGFLGRSVSGGGLNEIFEQLDQLRRAAQNAAGQQPSRFRFDPVHNDL